MTRPPRNRVLRRLTPGLIAWCVALGAGTTVVVAWGMAAYSPFASDFRQTDVERAPSSWAVGESPIWALWIQKTPGSTHWQATGPPPEPPHGDDTFVTNVHQFGLPLRSVESVFKYNHLTRSLETPGTSLAVQVPDVVRPEWTMVTGANYATYFPTRPIWSGLVIDTAMFGAIWVLGLLLIGAARRRRRVRRGRCAECAYLLGGVEVCPECGEPRPTRKGRQDAGPSGD